MTYDPERHHRRSIRLKGYDYAQAGAYFVTVCAEGRECSFGTIIDGVMRLNDAGRMVERWWLELNNKYPTVDTDEYSVMPNHFHGVIVITADDVRAALCGRPSRMNRGIHHRGIHTGMPLPMYGRPCVAAPSRMNRGNHHQGIHIQGCPYGCHADVGRCRGLVQNDDDQRIHPRGENVGMAAV